MVKIEIKDKKENKLLGRLEVSGKLVFEGATPSNEVVRDMLAVELKADKELVIVKHIYSKFSYTEADFLVYVYEDKEKMAKMEVMTKHLRKKAEEAAKKAAEKAKEEKVAEEKKEDKPVAAKEEAPAEEVPAKEGAPAEEKVEDKPAEEEKKEEKPAEEAPAKEEAPAEEKKEGGNE